MTKALIKRASEGDEKAFKTLFAVTQLPTFITGPAEKAEPSFSSLLMAGLEIQKERNHIVERALKAELESHVGPVVKRLSASARK